MTGAFRFWHHLPMSTTDDSEASTLVRLARTLMTPVGVQPTLQEVVLQATRLVPAPWAAALVADRITTSQATLAATSDEALTDVIARVAAAARMSPGWTAFDTGEVVSVPDLTTEPRFGIYPAEMVSHTPVRSVLSVPLLNRDAVAGVLTLYADRPHHFGPAEIDRATYIGAHAGIALTLAAAEDQAFNLQRALTSSRTISAAVGILVERHRLREEGAFDVLRFASQLANVRVVELAEQLVDTGRLVHEDEALRRARERR